MTLLECTASADMPFGVARMSVYAKFQSGAPGHQNLLDLAVTDNRR